MPYIARSIAPKLAKNAAITDVGSVKSPVVRDLESVFGGRFVGSHPMAGSERSGLDSARADLFAGAACIITPTALSDVEALDSVRDLWRVLGGRIVEMSPEAHDESIARVSHLPHAIAAALVHAVNHSSSDVLPLAGGGYRDTTRVAAGPPALWAEILLENRTALLAGLEDAKIQIDLMKKHILAGDAGALEAYLADAKDIRSQLP